MKILPTPPSPGICVLPSYKSYKDFFLFWQLKLAYQCYIFISLLKLYFFRYFIIICVFSWKTIFSYTWFINLLGLNIFLLILMSTLFIIVFLHFLLILFVIFFKQKIWHFMFSNLSFSFALRLRSNLLIKDELIR